MKNEENKEGLKRIDAQRRAQIWKWLLDPQTNSEPQRLTTQELLAVYTNNVFLILEFQKALKRMERMYQHLRRNEACLGMNLK